MYMEFVESEDLRFPTMITRLYVACQMSPPKITLDQAKITEYSSF